MSQRDSTVYRRADTVDVESSAGVVSSMVSKNMAGCKKDILIGVK